MKVGERERDRERERERSLVFRRPAKAASKLLVSKET
jgi:hypothetical protein